MCNSVIKWRWECYDDIWLFAVASFTWIISHAKIAFDAYRNLMTIGVGVTVSVCCQQLENCICRRATVAIEFTRVSSRLQQPFRSIVLEHMCVCIRYHTAKLCNHFNYIGIRPYISQPSYSCSHTKCLYVCVLCSMSVATEYICIENRKWHYKRYVFHRRWGVCNCVVSTETTWNIYSFSAIDSNICHTTTTHFSPYKSHTYHFQYGKWISFP